MINPYIGFGKIVLDDRLVGRKKELTHIIECLCSKAGSISIIGEPRIGKSSLATQALKSVSDSCDNTLFIYTTISIIPCSNNLFETILYEIASNASSREINLPAEFHGVLKERCDNGYESYKKCRRGLKILKKLGYNLVAVLDEFDAIIGFDDAKYVIQCIRELIDHWYETGLTAVIISRRSLSAIENQVPGVSNLDGVCEKQYIKPLNMDGLFEMMVRGKESWSITEIDLNTLWYYTGGHPYLAEMVLYRSWDSHSVESGFKASIGDIFDYYENLRALLTADGLFEQLLQAVIGPAWKPKTEAIEKLARYGLINKIDEPEIAFAAWSEHFYQYLGKCSREAPIWELWSETEIELRKFIDGICRRQHGQDWLMSLVQQNKGNLQIILDDLLKKMNSDKRVFGNNASDRLLDYSYPMQLWDIISAEWNIFRPVLKRDKSYWRERFELLASIRNPHAHNRGFVVPECKINLAEVYCKEILNAINNYWQIN
jgi:hypothetical protein